MGFRCLPLNTLVWIVVGTGCSSSSSQPSVPAPTSDTAGVEPTSVEPTPTSASPAPSSTPANVTGDANSSEEEATPSASAENTLAPESTASTVDATSDVPSSSPTPTTDCTIEASHELSAQIGTVGIVTLTTDLGPLDGGYIEFGRDVTYGTRAPLDVTAPDHRTLLLGLNPTTQYHYRVVGQVGTQHCESKDYELTTETPPDDLPKPTVTVSAADKVAPGYIITSGQATSGGGGAYIVIYDEHAAPVWWYQTSISGLVTRARLSWDGKYMYGRDGNPSARAGGQVVRIPMDGSGEESLTVDTGHHDLAVTPDNGVLFLVGGGGDGCSRIQKWSADDTVSDFYDLREAFGDTFKTGNDPCHCNSIDYNAVDESVSVSCLSQNAYVKLSNSAELIWVLGGNNGQSQFTGDINWNRQHGHHSIGPERILFFNNNGGGDSTSESSLAVELQLDLENKTATRVWEYDGGETSQTLGDVQRLPNGNTLVTYCNAGILHEIDSDKQPVQQWQFGNGTGYSEHRPSLYDPALLP